MTNNLPLKWNELCKQSNTQLKLNLNNFYKTLSILKNNESNMNHKELSKQIKHTQNIATLKYFLLQVEC